jgi:hypothetical protein
VLVLGTTEQHVALLTELDPEELASFEPVELPLEAGEAAEVEHDATRLAGSLLSAATWRQAVAAVRRAS